MVMTESHRYKPKSTVYTILLSVCLFLGVICACLLVALVLVGKHLALQGHCLNGTGERTNRALGSPIPENKNNRINHTTTAPNSIEDDDILDDEISVKIKSKKDESWRSGWRLPRSVAPSHYNLTINPDLSTGWFTGSNDITITVTEPRDHIIIHSHLLNITKIKLSKHGKDVEILGHHEDLMHQLEVVDLVDTLKPGEYNLYVEFNGNMKNRVVGLYKSHYYEPISGKKR